jgi:hypothetical protein
MLARSLHAQCPGVRVETVRDAKTGADIAETLLKALHPGTLRVSMSRNRALVPLAEALERLEKAGGVPITAYKV